MSQGILPHLLIPIIIYIGGDSVLAQEHRFILCEALLCELIDENETEEALVVSEEDGAEVVEHPRIYHGL